MPKLLEWMRGPDECPGFKHHLDYFVVLVQIDHVWGFDHHVYRARSWDLEMCVSTNSMLAKTFVPMHKFEVFVFPSCDCSDDVCGGARLLSSLGAYLLIVGAVAFCCLELLWLLLRWSEAGNAHFED